MYILKRVEWNAPLMCEDCFRLARADGFPEDIIKRYLKRNSRFTMDRRPEGEVEHLKFFYEAGIRGDEFWKGVEFAKFDDGRPQQYRICYWANRGKGKGWKWGQYAVFFTKEIYDKLDNYIRTHPDGRPYL